MRPYSVASSTLPPVTPTLTPVTSPRSPDFSDDQGTGASISLPKRKPTKKKAIFHFNEEQYQEGEANDNDSTQKTPTLFLSLPPKDSDPFPSTSSLLSPLSPTEPRSVMRPPIATPSIIPSNDRPLKPSLKSSSSPPRIPHIPHMRAQSAPAAPNLLKNVHFAESDDGFESVRIFKRSSKPVGISRPAGEDSETETEVEPSAYPFSQSFSQSPPAIQGSLPVVDPDRSTPVPNPSNSHANIYIESLSLRRSRPATLYGSVLVRNIAFHKQVALRFTLDNWEGTSEVTCKHVNSLAQLPPPFPQSRAVGGVIGQLASGEGGSQEFKWDRFSFVIHLELYEQKLTELNIFFVGRFTVPGVGEWWDNNDGMNYCISFNQPHSSPGRPPSQNKPFTALSTMKATPVSVTPDLSVEDSGLPSHKISLALPNLPSPPLPPQSPDLREALVSQWALGLNLPQNAHFGYDKTSHPPLAEHHSISGGVNPSQLPQKLVNQSNPPPLRVTSPIQTPTPPISHSGSLEEVPGLKLKSK